jgi:hypothetical protein
MDAEVPIHLVVRTFEIQVTRDQINSRFKGAGTELSDRIDYAP